MLVYVLVAEETVYVVLVQVAQEGYEDAATQTVPMQTDGAIQDDAEHVIEVGVDVLRGVGAIDGVEDDDVLSLAGAESVGVGDSEVMGDGVGIKVIERVSD